MPTDYDPIADHYRRAKLAPWRRHVELHTFLHLLGDVSGLAVLDLACGEGFLTREIRRRGAARVVGVDASAEMVRLARETELRVPVGVAYEVADARAYAPAGPFDVVTAGYLLNYARTADELTAMCHAVRRCLKPGGRFVTVNNNPSLWEGPRDAYRKYGLRRAAPPGTPEGGAVEWTFFLDGGGEVSVTNYHFTRPTHEAAFAASGLAGVRWHEMRVSADGLAEFGGDYWAELLDAPPVVCLECRG